MTISSETRKAGPFVGDNIVTALPFAFKVFSAADVRVVRAVTATGVETDLVLTTHFTVALNGDQDANPGGIVNLNTALAIGYTAVVTSAIGNLQPTQITNGGGFFPRIITDALDRLTILVQQVAERLSRSLSLPISASSGVSTNLPAPVASNLLGWNSSANALQNYAGVSSAPVSPTMTPVVGAISLALGRAALGAGAMGDTLFLTTTAAAARAAIGSLTSVDLTAVAAGTADVITANFTPDITAWTDGLRFTLAGCLANATTTPTVNPDGLGPKTIVNQGNLPLIPGDMPPQADLQYNAAYGAVVLLNPLEVTEAPVVTVNDAGNARTFTLQPCVLLFRNATLTFGSVVKRRVPAAISFTFSSGSTAGAVNAVQSDIAVVALDNAGAVELGANNLAGGVALSEIGVISTTAEGGAGAADSATAVYSTTARANLAYCVLSVIRSTQAVAGTWVTAPTLIQSVFGQAFASMSSLGYGQTWQNVTGSRAQGTTYYNTTGRPIQVAFSGYASGSNGSAAVNGASIFGGLGRSTYFNTLPVSFIVPPGGSYSISNHDSVVSWFELR